MEVTDKQKYVLKNAGIPDTVIDSMDRATASKAIESIKLGTTKSTQIQIPKPEKPTSPQTSYYVRYATDICMALINAGRLKDGLNPDLLMEEAVMAVKYAREELG